MSFKKMSRRAALVFTAADWKWGMGDKAHVPDRQEIEDTLRDLCDGIEQGGRCETGRLVAINEDDELKLCLVLGSVIA